MCDFGGVAIQFIIQFIIRLLFTARKYFVILLNLNCLKANAASLPFLVLASAVKVSILTHHFLEFTLTLLIPTNISTSHIIIPSFIPSTPYFTFIEYQITLTTVHYLFSIS